MTQTAERKTFETNGDRYRHIFNNAGNAIVIIDADFLIVSTNKEFDAITSYPKSEIEKIKNLKEFLLEDDIILLDSYNQLIKTNPAFFPVKFKLKLFDRFDSFKSIVATFGPVGETSEFFLSMIDVTGNEFAEIALHDSESKYKRLFENMTAGFALFEIIFDNAENPAAFIILDANAVFEKIAKISGKDIKMLKLSPANFQNDFIYDVITTFYKTAITGKVENINYYSIAENKWYEIITYSPGFGQVAMLFIDISNYKNSETETKKAYTFLNYSMNAIDNPIAIIDEIGFIKYANAEWSEKITENPFFGTMCPVGQNYLEHCDKIDGSFKNAAQSLKNSIFQALMGEAVKEIIDYSYIAPNGKKHWLIIKVTHFEISNSFNIVISHIDITDLKKKEEALKLNETRLEALLKLSQMKEVSTKQLFDYALEETVTVTESQIGFLGMVSDDERKISIVTWSKQAMAECKIQNKPLEFDLENTGIWGDILRYRKPLIINDYNMPYKSKKGIPEGHTKLHKFMGIPVKEDGKIVIVAAVANKIDDYNESDIRQLTLFMDGMWRIIQKKNAEKALLDANEKLKELDKLKTDFLNTVSHELRTPLTSIMGFSKIIHKKLEKAIQPIINTCEDKTIKNFNQVLDNIRIIVEESERLTMLVNDILDVAKLEAKKVDWKIKPVSVKELIEKSINATSGLFASKNIELIKNIEDDLPEVAGDSDKLMQVIINLISNAVKFTEKGSVTCSACLREDEIVVGIKDTGLGIAPDDQKKVFEKFKQVGDTLTNKPSGTGLGLPICQQIVEHHGGNIWVESEPGKGSTFYFSLTINSKTQEKLNKNIETLILKLKENILDLLLGDELKNIMLVDEDMGMRRLLKKGLEASGYKIIEAVDGIDAIAKIKVEKNRPDLIILEVSISKMNGFDIASILKNDQLTSGTPILIVSIQEGDGVDSPIDIGRYYIL